MMKLRVVAVGDSQCGKKALIQAFTRRTRGMIVINGNSVKLKIKSTSRELVCMALEGLSNDRETKKLIIKADVFLLCFSVDDPESLQSIKRYWIPGIRKVTNATALLVGTKTDLRLGEATRLKLAEKDQKPVMLDHGLDMSKAVNADGYIECSATQNDNILPVFELAAVFAIQAKSISGRLKLQGQKNKTQDELEDSGSDSEAVSNA